MALTLRSVARVAEVIRVMAPATFTPAQREAWIRRELLRFLKMNAPNLPKQARILDANVVGLEELEEE